MPCLKEDAIDALKTLESLFNQNKIINDAIGMLSDQDYHSAFFRIFDLLKIIRRLSISSCRSEFDTWLLNLLKKFDTFDMHDRLDMPSLLSFATSQHLNSVTTFLITHHRMPNYDSKQKPQKPVLHMISDIKEREVISNILGSKAPAINKINIISKEGETLLFLAVSNKNKVLIEELLKLEETNIAGCSYSTTVFDLVRYDSELLFKLINHVKLKENLWEKPFVGPIGLLGDQHISRFKSELYKKIEELQIFRDNGLLKQKLIDFLEDKTPLPFKRVNRVAIVYDVISYLMHPEWISQHNKNICGCAVVMQQLVINNPAHFISSVIEMCTLETTKDNKYLPKRVTKIPPNVSDTALGLADIWLETLRDSYNSFTGYSAISSFEYELGLLSPYKLELMFEEFGFCIQQENMTVRFNPSTRRGFFFESVREKIYEKITLPAPFKINGKAHIESDPDTKFSNFAQLYTQNVSEVTTTVLLSMQLINKLLNEKCNNGSNLLEKSHYINIRNFLYDSEKGVLSFDMLTYGQCYKINNFNAKDFKEGFLGCLVFDKIPEKVQSQGNDDRYPQSRYQV